MPLYSQITDDIKTAMKSGDRTRVDVLRFVLASLNNSLKEKQAKDAAATLTDEEVISILQKEVKRRKESIELFRQGNREDLIAKEDADLTVIAAYLPRELTREEIERIVDAVIAAGANDFSSAMREATKLTKGRADGRVVGEIVKTKLG
jgi:uncharacterized protein YqeY